MNKYIKIIIVLLMIHVFSLNAYATSDIDNHWAKPYIDKLLNNNIIKGYSDNNIMPDNYITRAEFITLVNNALGYTDVAQISFNDVTKENWFYEQVSKAVSAGYIKGYDDNSFKPNNLINREEAAVIFYRAFNMNKVSTVSNFIDTNKIEPWGSDAVNALNKNGYISGYEDNTFRPKNSIKRAEAFVMLSKILYNANSQDYNIMKNALYNFQTSVKLTEKYSSHSQLEDKIMDVINDSPDISFYVSSYYKFSSDFSKVNFEYRYSKEEALTKKEELNTIANRIISTQIKSGMNDFEKIKAIHDYIVLNTQYDDEGLAKYEANKSIQSDIFNAYGALINKKAVCEGYAEAMKLLLNKLNIKSQIITGTINDGESHAWNLVMLDNEYYHIDATFDDSLLEGRSEILYDYFNVTDTFMKKDRTWDESKYPKANGTKYNYYSYNNLLVNSKKQLEEKIISLIKNKVDFIDIRYEGFNITESEIDDILSKAHYKGKYSIALYDDKVIFLDITYSK